MYVRESLSEKPIFITYPLPKFSISVNYEVRQPATVASAALPESIRG